MIRCPRCGERAEHRVYHKDEAEFPEGGPIRICHAHGGAYIHVLGTDGEENDDALTNCACCYLPIEVDDGEKPLCDSCHKAFQSLVNAQTLAEGENE